MNRLRQYRFLMIVCGLAILAGVWEATHKGSSGEKTGGEENVSAPKTSELPPDRKVYDDAFPGSSNAEFDLGLEYYHQQNYTEALTHFRRALASGVKTNQDLLWYYPMALLHVDADEAEIDEAIANWHRNFPHSEQFEKYYNPYWTYAFQLMADRAEPRKVEAAISRWERKKPAGNTLPDLRNPPRELFPRR